jgi:hypothetical protein
LALPVLVLVCVLVPEYVLVVLVYSVLICVLVSEYVLVVLVYSVLICVLVSEYVSRVSVYSVRMHVRRYEPNTSTSISMRISVSTTLALVCV